MTLAIRKSRILDVIHLAGNLRPEDREELQALGLTPFDGLLRSVKASSMSWTVDYDGTPLAIFGCSPYGDGIGSPWLLAGDDKRIARDIVRLAPKYIAVMQKEYPQLFNYIYHRQHKSIRWLKSLGFSFDEKLQAINGHDFLIFRKGQ